MSCSLETIERYMEALPDARPWEVDHHVAPVPWKRRLAVPGAKRLRIGFVIDDGVVKVQPPIARAMQETIEALREAGHEGMPTVVWTNFQYTDYEVLVIEWDASSHSYAYDIWEKAILSDGGESYKKKINLTGEPAIEGMLIGKPEDTLTTMETHQVREQTRYKCQDLTPKQLNADKYNYESAYLDRWLASGIDALIMPSTPWVGYKPWTWVRSSAYVGYTSIWNLVGYAALAMPITTVSREKDTPDQEWLAHVPRNDSDEFNKEQCKSVIIFNGRRY